MLRKKRIRLAKEKEARFWQQILHWNESPEGREVTRRLETEFMPFALQHSRALDLHFYHFYGISQHFEPPRVALRPIPDEVTDEEAAAIVQKMRDAFSHVVGDFTLEGALAQIEKFKKAIEYDIQKKESTLKDAAYFHQVRAGARRMDLLTEAFRKNLDGEPIFIELASATTPQELDALTERLAATPAITPLVAFDRALTS